MDNLWTEDVGLNAVSKGVHGHPVDGRALKVVTSGSCHIDCPLLSVGPSPMPIDTPYKLPNELIQIIFEEYADSLEWSSIAFRDFLNETLPLTWVCSLWRQIGLRTPSLWDHVHFDIGSDLIPGFLYIASVVLERSGSRPLWVKIRRDDLMDFNFLYEVITPHLGRLHHLELDLVEIPTSSVLRAVRDQSSRLQTLIITDSDGGVVINPDHKKASVPALSLPSLRAISLLMKWRVPQPPFRASDLDSLTLSMPTWAWPHLRTLLPLYPSIRNLQLDFNRKTMYDNHGSPIFVSKHGQSPPIPLPHLQYLRTDDPSICLDLETIKASILHVQDDLEDHHSSIWPAFCNNCVQNSPPLTDMAQLRRLEAHWANVRTIQLHMLKFDSDITTVSLTASILACAGLVETLELHHCRGLHVILSSLLAIGAVKSAAVSEGESRNTSSSSVIQTLSPIGRHEAAAACLPFLKKLLILGPPSNIPTELAELQIQRPTLEIVNLVADEQQHMEGSENSKYVNINSYIRDNLLSHFPYYIAMSCMGFFYSSGDGVSDPL
ncbi:hypothetical protein DL93DRAFT_2167351 [Clavulina sp. PMI_390]|nr:hypothetical protein DL93DRAFT_2167351 [Clavulina sp. PMI_390]